MTGITNMTADGTKAGGGEHEGDAGTSRYQFFVCGGGVVVRTNVMV